MNRKTEIVTTIGPASSDMETLTRLVEVGINVMRLNFSHGDFEEHQEKIDNLREIIKKTGADVKIMQDLGGPEIRTGIPTEELVEITKGSTVTFSNDELPVTETHIALDYAKLSDEVKVGERTLVDDGAMVFKVTAIKNRTVETVVEAPGMLKARRGVNLPDSKISLAALTDKDKGDLAFGIKNNVDYVAFSFIRTAEDVRELRVLLDEAGSKALIIPKIETAESIENLDEIIEAADGLMVARGDLAAEVGFAKVPLLQKEMVRKCNEKEKYVIVATQMLETMIEKPRPTRAEVNDIANAVIDGADAVMLSAETANGKHPIESVELMDEVLEVTEAARPSVCATGTYGFCREQTLS